MTKGSSITWPHLVSLKCLVEFRSSFQIYNGECCNMFCCERCEGFKKNLVDFLYTWNGFFVFQMFPRKCFHLRRENWIMVNCFLFNICGLFVHYTEISWLGPYKLSTIRKFPIKMFLPWWVAKWATTTGKAQKENSEGKIEKRKSGKDPPFTKACTHTFLLAFLLAGWMVLRFCSCQLTPYRRESSMRKSCGMPCEDSPSV